MPKLSVVCLLLPACILAAEDLTGKAEVLGNPVRQWFGPTFPLAGSGSPVAFQGRIYIGWGDTNNRWLKPVLAYRTADDRFVNDMPFQRLAHSCIDGGHGVAFSAFDNELFVQDYDNQAGGQQFSRMRGGWRMTWVGSGTGSDGAGKGHDTDVVRFRGQLLRERGQYLAGGANLSVNADGAAWRIAGRGANYPRNGAAQNWLFPDRLLPVDGSLAMIGQLFTYGSFPAEAPVAALATWTGDAAEPARAALFEAHQLLGGAAASVWLPFQGRVIGCTGAGGFRADRLIGADTGLATFAWPDPDQGVSITYRYSPYLAEITGRATALSVYETSAGMRTVLRQSEDGLAWSEVWRLDLAAGDRPYGVSFTDGAWYLGFGDPSASGGTGRNGNLLRLRPGNANLPPTITLDAASVGDAIAPGSAALAATASDPDGSIARVEFFAGTTYLGSDTTAPYTWDWSAIPAGTWTITARAVDSQGAITSTAANGTGSSAYRTVTIAPDVPAGYPTVRLVDHAADAVYTVQGSRDLVLFADAADPGGDIDRVEFWADGAKLGETATAANFSGGAYSWTWTDAPAGTHAITAIAVDSAGNRTVSEPVTALIEANPALPVVSLVAPATAVPGQHVVLAVSATDDDGIERVDVLANGACIGSATAAPWQVAWTVPAAGTWSLVARATDGRDGVALSVARTLVANASTTLPTPSGLSATARDSRRIDLAWSAAGGGTQLQIERTATTGSAPAGSAVWVRVATLPDGARSWTDLLTQPGFTYFYRIRCADDQGNGTWSALASAATAAAEAAIPAAATGLTATAVPGTDAAIDLAWIPASGATAQAVMARRTGSISYHGVAWLPGDAATFRHRGLNGTGGWEYTVLAFNGASRNRSDTAVLPVWPASCTASTGAAGTLRRLTVVDGTGGGDSAPHRLVQISAGPMPEGYAFVCWRATAGTPEIVDPWNRHTAVFVPDGDATVTAVWRSLGTIPDPTVSVQVSAASVVEGAAAIITATLSTTTARAVTVDLARSGGAGAGDAVLSATGITIPAGSLTGSVTLQTIADGLHEADETVIIGIATATNATPAAGPSTVTILDDDPAPVVSLTATGTVLAEAGGTVDITLSLSAVSGSAASATLALGGSAVAGGDFMTGPVTVTIPPGGSSATVRLTGIADGLDEADETVSISCAAVTGAVSAGDVLTLTLPDADPEPAAVLEVSRTTLAEGGPAAVVTASLVAVSGRDVRLTLALAGTVQASEVLLSQTELLIPAGSRSAACTLAALADTEVEAAETVVIAIAAAEHASWPPEGRTMTVTDAAAPAASETLVTGSGAGSGGGDCGSGGLAAILVGVIAMAGLRRRRSP